MLAFLIPLFGIGLVAYDVAKRSRGAGLQVKVDDEVEILLDAVPYEVRVEWVRTYQMPVETKSLTVSVMGANDKELEGMVLSFNQPKNFHVIRGKAPTVKFKRSDVTSVQRGGMVIGATETFTSSLRRPASQQRFFASTYDPYAGGYTARCYSNRPDGRCQFYGGTGHSIDQTVPNGSYVVVLPHAAAPRPGFTYVRSYQQPGLAGYLPTAWLQASAGYTLQRRRLF